MTRTTIDPSAQPGLILEMEPGAIPVRYVNRYHTDHDVPCALCPPKTPHRRGFTAEMDDGRRALCGRDCGRRYFGLDAARTFEAALDRTEHEERRDVALERARQVLPSILPEIEDRWAPMEAEAYRAIHRLPRPWPGVQRRDLTDGGDLIVYRIESYIQTLPSGVKVPMERRREIGRIIQAQSIFMEAGRFQRAMTHGRSILEGRDYRHREMSPDQLLGCRNGFIQSVRDGASYLDAARAFLTKDNMRELDKAIRESPGHREKVSWKLRGGVGLVEVRDGRGEKVRMELPDLSSRPNTEEMVRELREGAEEEQALAAPA